MELLITIDAPRARSSARRITAVMPYCGFAARIARPVAPPITAKLVANLITHASATAC
jgi:ribose-phosphate pyrophosphokinase